MFVEIDNKNMDALKVEEWIKINRDANGGVISPEFAMEILGKTNHFAHIKKVLNNIKKSCLDENGKLVKDKVLVYKEFLLSCVDGREMSPQAMSVLQDLAEKGGCKDEFAELNSKPKWYYKNDCDNIDIKIVKSKEELEALEGEDLVVYFDADVVSLFWYDLSKVKALKFREGAVVNLGYAKNLPKELDVSMCSKVELWECDLEGLNLKFREGASVNLVGAKNLPEVLDFSQCYKVNLGSCDLEGVKEIKFREEAEVDFLKAKNLPEVLDLSMCSKVNLSCCDLSEVSTITFKNKEQEEKFMEENNNFRGKVVYADEDKKEKEDNSLFSRIRKRFGSGGMGE